MILVAAIDLIGSLRKPRASGDDPGIQLAVQVVVA